MQSPAPRTAKAKLLDVLLREAGHGGLHDVIRARRADGTYWSQIAKEISEITDVQVSHMALITWAREMGVHDDDLATDGAV